LSWNIDSGTFYVQHNVRLMLLESMQSRGQADSLGERLWHFEKKLNLQQFQRTLS